MALFYIGAGINHFIHPSSYVEIMPTYLPHPLALVYVSGIAEIVCAVLLIPKKTRRLGAWLVIALLIAVFPANIQMFMNYWNESNPLLWITILRLPIQIVLIWWAWLYTK